MAISSARSRSIFEKCGRALFVLLPRDDRWL
jgi:hypothetical protein